MRVLFAALITGSLLMCAEPVAVSIGSEHYRVFRADGTAASLDDIVSASRRVSVTFLGENHDDPVAHHLEIELFKRMADSRTVLSMEMFERDVQGVVDEYLAGLITEDHLVASGRAWKNYKSDYRPLVEYAKSQKIPVIAANAPRRYVNRVSRLGKNSLHELSESARATLPPLPYSEASPEYGEKFLKLMEEMNKEASKEAKKDDAPKRNPPDPQKSLQAQSLWDASMAHSISEALKDSSKSRVIHINGSFHTDNRLGIVDHLKLYQPKAATLVVAMHPLKSFPEWDRAQLPAAGDFVIITDPKARKHEPPKPEGHSPPPAKEEAATANKGEAATTHKSEAVAK